MEVRAAVTEGRAAAVEEVRVAAVVVEMGAAEVWAASLARLR